MDRASSGRRRQGSWWGPLGLLLVGTACSGLAALVVYAQVRSSTPEPTCEGIGFGCSLSPEDTAALAAAAVGIVGFVATCIASLVWSLLRGTKDR